MKKMNEKLQAAIRREAYEAPKCEIIEVQNEGVLCGSGVASASHEGFEEVDCSSIWD